MVKEIDRTPGRDDGREKVLVCITAQSNSKRLIDKGAQIADEANGELHILHVEKGSSIFLNEDTPKLLQQLFEYGSEKNAMVHMYCDENVPVSIAEFVRREKITKVVLGEPPAYLGTAAQQKEGETHFHKILRRVSRRIQIFVVERGAEEEKISESLSI